MVVQATGTFFEDFYKLHEFAQIFSVHKCNAMKFNEFYGLVTTVLVKISYIRKLFVEHHRGSSTVVFLFYRRGRQVLSRDGLFWFMRLIF